jgi:hypothetical protein
LPITWTATLRADQACRLGDELFAKAVRSGLRRVMVGVESGSQEMLDRLQKDMKLEQVRATAEMCTRHGVGAIFNFIVGFPANRHRACRRRSRSRRSCADRIRIRDADLLLPAVSREPMADLSAAQGYVFPRGSKSGRTSTTSAAAARGSRTKQWKNVERFKFYTQACLEAGAWRWPLRTAAQWRCDHDWYDLPVEKTDRRLRAAAAAGVVMESCCSTDTFSRSMPPSSA